MKKKIFMALCIVILYCFYLQEKRNIYQDIFLDNIDALGSSENGTGGCIWGGNLKCGGSSGYSSYS